MRSDGKENRPEVFMKAFEFLSKAEKRVVISRLLDDPQLREEILDTGHIEDCDSVTSRPLEGRLEDRVANEG